MSDLFRTAPREVIRYFDERGIKTSWRWKDFAAHQHALDFTVARTAGFDVIGDLRNAVRKAVVDRVPFEQFQKELVPILQQKGWWGKRVVKGPTGEKELVQLGSTRRLQTIYWANTASAHAAGEWARTQGTKDVLPYLQYKISLSERRRKEHEGWVGITLPVDDAWWRTHYPPNGWHCKCRVEQIGDSRADKAPADKRRAPPLNPRTWTDKRTGKNWRVPEGIDPGWQRNPGVTREIVAARELQRARRDALRPDASPEQAMRAATVISSAIRRTPEFRAIAGNAPGKPWPWPKPLSEGDRAWQKLRAAVAIVDAANAERLNVPALAVVELTGHDAPKMTVRHGIRVEDYDLVQDIISDPDHDGVAANGKWQYVKVIEGKPWLVILKRTREGEIYLNSFHRLDQDDPRIARISGKPDTA
jgi:SPP1 gp7 family putative phage head morphogenesis protein